MFFSYRNLQELGARDAMNKKIPDFHLQDIFLYMKRYNFEKKYGLLEKRIKLDIKEKKENMERLMENFKNPFR